MLPSLTFHPLGAAVATPPAHVQDQAEIAPKWFSEHPFPFVRVVAVKPAVSQIARALPPSPCAPVSFAPVQRPACTQPCLSLYYQVRRPTWVRPLWLCCLFVYWTAWAQPRLAFQHWVPRPTWVRPLGAFFHYRPQDGVGTAPRCSSCWIQHPTWVRPLGRCYLFVHRTAWAQPRIASRTELTTPHG